MRVLVTGGSGFIGHNVVRILESWGHECTVIDTCTDYNFIPEVELAYLMRERQARISAKVRPIDIRHVQFVNSVFKAYKPETVIHLASYPRQKIVAQYPLEASDVMNNGLINLLERGRDHKIEKFVYVSSSMVYGDFPHQTIDGIDESAECCPRGQYAIMKYMGEKLVADYKEFEHAIVRPSAVYGEWDVEDRVVSKFITAAMRGETITVNGADEILDFTHVDDTAVGIALAATKPTPNRIYNITRSNPQEFTLLDAANLCRDITGGGVIEQQERSAMYPSRGRLSINAARRDLAFDPQINIEQGFKRYYDWYNQDSLLWHR